MLAFCVKNAKKSFKTNKNAHFVKGKKIIKIINLKRDHKREQIDINKYRIVNFVKPTCKFLRFEINIYQKGKL